MWQQLLQLPRSEGTMKSKELEILAATSTFNKEGAEEERKRSKGGMNE